MPEGHPSARIARPVDEAAASASAVPAARSSNAAIAPAWHTTAVLFVMLGFSLLGARVQLPAFFDRHGRAPRYLIAMVMEWTVVGFIWWGLNRRGLRLSELIGGRWRRGVDVLRDLAIGIAFVIIVGGAGQLLGSMLKAATPQAVSAMLPQTPFEMILWVPLSLTGGFCEEVIFRGYLQRQFSVLTRSVTIAIVLQAIIFGLSHGYQGWKMMLIIAVYGICFGCLAHWRRGLRPGMLGHALQDTAGGLLGRLLVH